MVAGIMQALIEHSTDNYEGNNRPQRALMGFGVALVVSAFNIFAAGHLSIAEGLFAICHVFALVPIITSLWVLVTPKNSAWEALGHFVDNGKYITPPVSWPSSGLSVLVGQASSIVSREQLTRHRDSPAPDTFKFIVLGTDAATHIAEEIEGADVVVPQCMVWSFFANMPLTVITLFTFGSSPKMLLSSTADSLHSLQLR